MFTPALFINCWHLEVESDDDDDVVKLTHTAVHQAGHRVILDVSPYKRLSDLDFLDQVLNGFPRRQSVQAA